MDGMPKRANLETIRAELRESSVHRFVSADEFYALMVSNSILQRIDIPAAQVAGLFNVETGMTYVIESELLDTDRTW